MEGKQNSEIKVENLENSSDNTDKFKNLDKGWSWVIMLASFGAFCLIGANMYGVGIMHATLLKRYGSSVSLTSWAGSLQTASMSLGAPLSSYFVDRFSCRTAVMLSGILFGTGYLGTAFAPNVETAIFTLGIIAGCGAGVGYTASMVVIGFSFKRRRHIALGFALSGMGAGLFALSPMMQLAYNYYGSTGFFIIQATMSLNIVTFGAMYFPSQLELHTQEMRKCNKANTKSDKSKSNCIEVFTQYCKALVNKPIALLSVGMFLNCVGTYLIYLHLPVYIVSKGFTEFQAAWMVSVTGILSVVGRIITGFVANLGMFKEIWLYAGTFGVVSVSTIVYPHISYTFAGHIVFAAVLGLFFGSCYVLMTAVNIRIVGIKFVSSAIGIELFFGGIGAVLGPVIAGVLVDNGGTYEQSFTFAGVCIFLAAVLSILTVCHDVPGKECENQNADKD
ncbi:monocarboxylate transporter 9-like [Mercenaria mercenaria]|uniref:monocarboxylate transporter 9-like n=1 Tax=Mercenaria mercenaria TaxID=6596 RepID=UPI00234E8EA8|nr:monocarboxylate transporter 9-like [Mercenaria mercenaria]XP_045190766.2 monocarboxylate transporter 9-like [Mercenaria mercenaria]